MILFCFLVFFPVKGTNVLQKVDFNGKLFSVTVLDEFNGTCCFFFFVFFRAFSQFLSAPNVNKNISPKLGLRVM